MYAKLVGVFLYVTKLVGCQTASNVSVILKQTNMDIVSSIHHLHCEGLSAGSIH